AQSLPIPETYKSLSDLQSQHDAEIEQNIAVRKLMRGDPKRRWIALTFDDGPHPDYTPRIVEILKRYKVHATFFVVGKRAEKHPELIQLLHESGEEIGNHTYDHVNLTKLDSEAIAEELEKCGAVIQRITGKTPTLFRPPGGDYNHTVAQVAESLGYWMVLWTDDPGDYANPPKGVLAERLFSQISNGGIILLHDGIPETLDLLPRLIEYLQSKGYEIVPVGAMIPAQESPSPPSGKIEGGGGL
ncbi:MAG: polysaccharide deacetylase family protein, partial [Fimbriimonadales bacterium]|nr:polysaccharide deacetylase family protein [Fimbriimonadales bacterium]